MQSKRNCDVENRTKRRRLANAAKSLTATPLPSKVPVWTEAPPFFLGCFLGPGLVVCGVPALGVIGVDAEWFLFAVGLV